MIGALLMAFVIVGSLFLMPAVPNNLLAYLFVAYMRSSSLVRLSDECAPDALPRMGHDLEEV